MRARAINEEMKVAASRALAALTKEDVPDSVLRAYGLDSLKFGPEYIIPKAARSTCVVVGIPGSCQGRHGYGCRPQADRYR